ncbi:hypothetical protein T484DRAFT_1747473 [Baffinella frigidus]|nr:hypothetical protein T484DRAFT_1747473 [Cryptophyta sp. CCMP2293]
MATSDQLPYALRASSSSSRSRADILASAESRRVGARPLTLSRASASAGNMRGRLESSSSQRRAVSDGAEQQEQLRDTPMGRRMLRGHSTTFQPATAVENPMLTRDFAKQAVDDLLKKKLTTRKLFRPARARRRSSVFPLGEEEDNFAGTKGRALPRFFAFFSFSSE